MCVVPALRVVEDEPLPSLHLWLPARPPVAIFQRSFGGCSAGVEQSDTRDSGLLLTFDIPKEDLVSAYCQSYG